MKKKGEPVLPPQKIAKPDPSPAQPLSPAQQNFIYWLGQHSMPNGINSADAPSASLPNTNIVNFPNPGFPNQSPALPNPNNPPMIWNPSVNPPNSRFKRQQVPAMSLGKGDAPLGTKAEALGNRQHAVRSKAIIAKHS